MKFIFAIILSLGLVSCTQKEKSVESFPSVKGEVVGELGLLGEIQFYQVQGGVEMQLKVRGLPKGKTLASHIHENYKCEPPQFTSAGSHFNPQGAKHGKPGEGDHHVGDLGNQEVDKNGNLQVTKVYPFLSLDPKSPSYIGNRSFIIHERADDFSQPLGNAGGRKACALLSAG